MSRFRWSYTGLAIGIIAALFIPVSTTAGHGVGPQFNSPIAQPPAHDIATRQGSITMVAVPMSTSSFSDGTKPSSIRAYEANKWSTTGYVDLTDVDRIPANAIVTNVRVSYETAPAGRFSMPDVYVFDEDNRGDKINRFSRQTRVHNEKRVRQKWALRFKTAAIHDHPATIWPRITISYEY